MLFGLSALLMCAAAAPVAPGPTIEPLTWQELVSGAKFVGVVRCEVAGELEAKFRVEESWKGAPAGTRLRVRMATDAQGLRAPGVLVGERALITLFDASPSRVVGSGSSGERVPLWFRKSRADGVLPLLQGWVPVPIQGHADVMGSGDETLEHFRGRVSSFLALAATEQDARILAELSAGVLAGAPPTGLAKSRSAQESVEALLRFGRENPSRGLAVAGVLARGGPSTLASLKKVPSGDLGQAGGEALDELEERWAPAQPQQTHREAAAPPTAKMMEKMHDALAEEDARTWNGAVSVLTVYDCDSVASALASWQPPARLPDYGFALGSWVAWRCGTHRPDNLSRMASTSADGWLRAWAASYLAIDDAAQGMAQLRKAAQLPGGPGDWAAVELARRGDASAMPRVLALLGRPADAAASPYVGELRSRAAVLLSNSAAASGVAAPPLSPMGGAERVEVEGRALESWWGQVSPAIHLGDPWLPELAAEKVD